MIELNIHAGRLMRLPRFFVKWNTDARRGGYAVLVNEIENPGMTVLLGLAGRGRGGSKSRRSDLVK